MTQAKKQKTKAIVETVGAFTYLNTDGEAIHHFRPTVVLKTQFIDILQSDGKIKILVPSLPEAATDEDFSQFFKESEGTENQSQLAVAAYASTFDAQPVAEATQKVEKQVDPNEMAKIGTGDAPEINQNPVSNPDVETKPVEMAGLEGKANG